MVASGIHAPAAGRRKGWRCPWTSCLVRKVPRSCYMRFLLIFHQPELSHMETPKLQGNDVFILDGHVSSFSRGSKTWKMGRINTGGKFLPRHLQVDELQGLQLCFLMILLALFHSLFWLHLNLVTKQLKQFQNMPTTTMSRERRLLLDIPLKECERIFPQDPSKAELSPCSLLSQSMARGKGSHLHQSKPPSDWGWG